MEKVLREFLKSLAIALWFAVLTFPIMVIKVNTIENTVEWRWKNMGLVALGAFVFSYLWRFMMGRRESGRKSRWQEKAASAAAIPAVRRTLFAAGLAIALLIPLLASEYRVNTLITALIYVVLGLGLNIVVGLAGLLDLGYVAFYAVGAYSYALLNHHYGLGFWAALPIGAALGAIFGILLGIPVLRLRGDYLAIVTLGFGEIIRLVLENWNEFSFGPSGIANIDNPTLFGAALSRGQGITFLYYLMIFFVFFTIFIVGRLQNSRLGRSWLALREDEIACQAMGIDRMKTKLAAFAMGATWAGMMGVVFAAKTSFINPASFTFLESALILAIVVLGGMGSIPGVILASFILVLLPEQLRAFSEYRMLVFGASMVLMMVFRPGGIVNARRRTYEFHGAEMVE
jgi:branched-chain amino acid transport system permease protein